MKTLLVSFISTALSLQVAIAGEVMIQSNNDKPLTIKITSEENNKLKVLKEIPPHGRLDILSGDLNLGDAKVYTIDGETHAFIGDKCKNLKAEKNYFITFTNDTVGTTCLAEEQ